MDNLNPELVADYSLKHQKVYAIDNMNSSETSDVQPLEVLSLTGINLKIDSDAGDEVVYWIRQHTKEVKTNFLIENRDNLKLIVLQLVPVISIDNSKNITPLL